MAGAWVNQIFRSKMAKKGGMVRRKIASIDKLASQSEVRAECAKRGFHVIEHADQWIIFCDKAQVKIIR